MQSNRIELAAYLSAKLEVRYLPSGTPVANARLGQTYEYVQNDKRVKHTNWFGLAFYGELAGVAQSYEKGDNIDVVERCSSGNSHRKTARSGPCRKSLCSTRM